VILTQILTKTKSWFAFLLDEYL